MIKIDVCLFLLFCVYEPAIDEMSNCMAKCKLRDLSLPTCLDVRPTASYAQLAKLGQGEGGARHTQRHIMALKPLSILITITIELEL